MKLNVGCGADFRAGWLNVDCRPLYAEGPEFLACDLRALESRIEDEVCEEIVARHVLEFLPWREVDAALCLLARKLARGGTLFVQVADAAAVLQDLAEGPGAFPLLQRRLYGNQGHAQDAHQSAWTAGVLRQRLGMVGLRIERLDATDGCLQADAVREA